MIEEKLWHIEPSGPLRGDVVVRGSKNGVSKHMVAAMLGSGESTIHNAPEVGEVGITADMLTALGINVEIGRTEIRIEPGPEIRPRVPDAFTGLNRIPILMLGPLLHLAGEAFVPLVGGDPIGRRPVNFHVEALRAMGAEVEVGDTGIFAKAKRLNGTRLELPYPSVGATETILMSAVLAEGKTVVKNAAMEPEVVELALFLQRMGARIELSPDRRIVIEGVERLRGASTWLAGDRIEAFSYLVAGLITGGEVRVHGCPQDRLVTAITTLARMGAQFAINDEYLCATAPPEGLRAAAVQTDTHPGFMTDWQTPLMVLFTQSQGMSVLHETVFENRLVYVPALKSMGCEIEVFDQCLGGPACRYHDTNARHSAVVRGVSQLKGADVTLPDIRAGFSAVLAAAVADGPSTLRGVHHIERGYHQPFEQFESLGLNIRRGQ
ncbi:UDP-N-acetylglucosamine 1-carboxyvinyltransferase [Nonomuraea glycinis]|uniref:UDP-N-acetylglucosamine 1-carboxyvinyltransferase n=1 Tax=Nonomuraea glycinis TaxID=2047744 RepID=A0A918E520_9ACTN|nr:UDP-N-acetylglucosamine 1-carboxyvinyltransferase [Nonomuraea glycinis]MCA2178781.1 UDP-N-acetylglucosamine 1-carboxyvinyltransferase [Nonomuraea glycinis]WSG65102.1 UDP-N-acetylglucosamine 1-carboxyvinyltransferase [Nonomuraea glycinis]GGP08029.1 UDP-N-acetylglucosamine 1-carboxyvinyltransferase [Nonomuraea glycinis]